jgi:integrase
MHKLRSLPDPTTAFFIQKMLSSYHKQSPSCDVRLPIDKEMLAKLVLALKHTCPGKREQAMLKAMFILAFHAFLRIGEITVISPLVNNLNLLSYEQVKLKGKAMEIEFRHYKHSTGQTSSITITATPDRDCPIKTMEEYFQVRGNTPGPLFSTATGGPITRSFFNEQLRLTLAFCRYPSTKFTSHSFRIGAATTAAAQGRSDAQIRLLGRWKSAAFKKYIRTSQNTSSL